MKRTVLKALVLVLFMTVTAQAKEIGPTVTMKLSLDRNKIAKVNNEPLYAAIDVEIAKSKIAKEPKPMALVFVIDVSGSMDGGKLEQVKRAAHKVIDMLSPRDRLSITTFSDSAYDLYSPAGTIDFAKAHDTVKNLRTIGGTNMIAGVRLGIKKMKALQAVGAVKRMLLFGDGDANVGTGDMKKIAAWARDFDAAVSTFGVGTNYNEAVMTKIAQVSGGNYYAIHDVSKTESTLRTELNEIRSLTTAQAQLIFKAPLAFEFDRAFGQPAQMEAGPKVVSLRDLDEGTKRRLFVCFQVKQKEKAQQQVFAVLLNYLDRKLGDGQQIYSHSQLHSVEDFAQERKSINKEVFIAGRKALVAESLERVADFVLGPLYGERRAPALKSKPRDFITQIEKRLRTTTSTYLPGNAELIALLQELQDFKAAVAKDRVKAAKEARKRAKELFAGK